MNIKQMRQSNTITVNNRSISYHKVNHDTNGNPRYVVHFLALDINPADYGKVPGLTKYRAKWFGGGYVITSYNLHDDLQYAFRKVNEYYGKDN